VSLSQFSGARLRDARVARGMTASTLAELLGVTSGAISHWEHEQTVPKPGVINRVAEALSLPESFFLRRPRVESETPYLYRSRSAATKRARESAEVRQRWFMEIFDFAEKLVQVPVAQVDDLSAGKSPTEISFDDIESGAVELRKRWGLGDGPIANVAAVVESRGCAVTRFAFGADDLNSFSKFGVRPTIVLNGDRDVCVRGRYDDAHELGHLVLHRGVDRGMAETPEMHKLLEAQAHRFAAAWLFPASSFVDEVYSIALDALLSIKRRWRVSCQMMIRRARDLDLINQDKYERAFRDLSRRGFRTAEPLDDELEPEDEFDDLRQNGLKLTLGSSRAV